jgi:SAM-dependent methyltransferase
MGNFTVSIEQPSSVVKMTQVLQENCFSPVISPSCFSLESPFDAYDLLIGSDCKLFIGSGPRPKRDGFIALARGFGVELGPGANPQVFSSSHVNVKYIEEKMQDEWSELYRSTSSQESSHWESYKQGTASSIPFKDGLLDFVFASHVFEHLYNPLGHIEHWSRKLKVGGMVLLVIPAQSGTKDYVQPLTRLDVLIREFEEKSFSPGIASYREWGKAIGNITKAEQLYSQRSSIHVHTYDCNSIIFVLEWAISRGLFDQFLIETCPCTKDFLVALKK